MCDYTNMKFFYEYEYKYFLLVSKKTRISVMYKINKMQFIKYICMGNLLIHTGI